jgi:integrase
MAHISKRKVKRPDGSSYVRWRARVPNPNRNRSQSAKVERTFATRREAERWLADQQTKQNRGEWVDPALSRRTVAAVAEEWAGTWLLDGLGPKTRVGYTSILNRHVLPAFGGAKVAEVSAEAVQTWLAGLSETLKPNTVRRIYTVLRNVFSLAVSRGYVGINPCDGVRFRRARVNGSEQSARVIVTEEEARAVATAIDPRYRLLILTAAYTGARAGELHALRRRDVDPLRGQLHIIRAMKPVTSKEAAEERAAGADVHGALVFGPTKTYERRRVTLPPWLAEEMEAHLATVPADRDALVFTTRSGEPIHQSNFYRRYFKPAVRAALPPEKHGLRFHDFRHSHASWLIGKGANLLHVSKRLGHRDIRTTANTYGHMFPSDEEALAAMFESPAQAVVTNLPRTATVEA